MATEKKQTDEVLETEEKNKKACCKENIRQEDIR